MKKAIIPIIVLGLAIIGCSKVKSLTTIEKDIPYTESLDASELPDSTVLSSVPLPITLPLPAVPIATNSQQILNEYNTSPDKVNSVTLKNASLQITQPAGAHLNFLKDVEIYLSADSLGTVLLSHKYNIPDGLQIVNMDDTDINMKNYFLQDTMWVQIKATFDSIPPPGTHIDAVATFHLSANPLN